VRTQFARTDPGPAAKVWQASSLPVSRILRRILWGKLEACPALARRVCRTVLAFVILLRLDGALNGAEIDVSKLPPPAPTRVDFDRDIKPIFQATCFRCHGPERPKSSFRLDNRQDALKGGDNGVAIVPGDSAKSPLIHFVAGLDEDLPMPPKGKGEPLTPAQIGLLRAWIDQGAKWPEGKPASTLSFSISPSVRWVTVSGNEQKFREDWWQKEGFTRGLEHFEFREQVGKDAELVVEGRAMYEEDYRLSLRLSKRDLGFIRAGYSEYRKSFDDSGGYHSAFDPPSYRLGRDLELDLGTAWVDVGLTLPKWPRLTLGYEHRFKDGTKSALQWSAVGTDPDARAIYPSAKQIDETVDIIKFDLSHEIRGVLIEDNFRGEFYKLRSQRESLEFFTGVTAVPDSLTQYRDRTEYFQGANAFRLEKQLRDWLLLSGGYLYTRLDGDAAFALESFFPTDPTAPPFLGDFTDQIVLDRESHIFNGNTRLGPWEGLTFTAGVQNEWTRQRGFGHAMTLGGFPTLLNSDLDKMAVEEDFGLRYTRIPFTVLFADARFQQERVGHFEQNLVEDRRGDANDFLRDTDASNDLKDVRAGFNLSPWTKVNLVSSYRHRIRENDFDHLTDTDQSNPARPPFGVPGNGYPAFILARDTVSDEVEAKLVLHAASWLKTSLKYQLTATEYTTATAPSITAFPRVQQPGGEILDGNYDANSYSLNTTLTPWRRLYLSATFLYSDSRLVSGVNNGTSLVPYAGDVYSVLSSANFALNDATDLHASYSFSRADYAQANEPDGLPLGIVYDRHGLVAGIRRQFKNKVSTNLQYGFFRYREPTAGRGNDYTAHAVFATVNVVLR